MTSLVPSRKEVLVFGFAFVLVLSGLSALSYYTDHHKLPFLFGATAVFMLLLTMFFPNALLSLFRINRSIALTVSKLIIAGLSALTLLLYFVPASLLRYLGGTAALFFRANRTSSSVSGSFWHPRLAQHYPKQMMLPYSGQRVRRRADAWLYLNLRKVVGFVVFALILLLLGELATRSYYRVFYKAWMPPSSQVSDLYLYDKHPFLGSVLEPRKVLYPTNPDSQGTLISINRWGFRGQDFAVPKSSGIFRIAAIGGSTTFGTKLNDDETWPTCLEKELRSQGKAVEVLNFGVPGYSSIEELILLESNVLDLRPDVVVIYAGYNDLKYNRAPASGPFASDYSHFKRVPFRESTIRTFLNRNSALWLAAVTKVNALKIRGSDNYLGRTGPRYDSIDPAGVKAFSRNLDSIISICVSKGMAVVLVSEARSFDAETQASDDLRRNAGSALYWVPQFSTKGLTEGFIEYAEAMADVVQRAARNEVVPVLYFDAHSRMPRDPDYYWDSVHMNRSGSELLAGLLAPTVSEAIEKLIILKEEK